MTAIEFLKSLPFLPISVEGRIPFHRPSNSELKRWLEKGSVDINHVRPKPHDKIEFPICKLQFFPGAKRQTTVVDDCWEFDGKDPTDRDACRYK